MSWSLMGGRGSIPSTKLPGQQDHSRARSFNMQKPEPWLGKARCVPPAVLHASPYSIASLAASMVPPIFLVKRSNCFFFY